VTIAKAIRDERDSHDEREGYKVFTTADLMKKGYPGTGGGEIYAVFEVESDLAFARQEWSGEKLMEVIREFENRPTYQKREIRNLGRNSPFPRVLNLRELLKAAKSEL
jgi:hypothetical protein